MNVIKSRSLSEITRPLTVVERKAFEEFKQHMRDVVAPAIVEKAKWRRRVAARRRRSWWLSPIA